MSLKKLLKGKKTYLGIAAMVAAQFAPQIATALGIDNPTEVAQAALTLAGAAVAAYGRLKVGKQA